MWALLCDPKTLSAQHNTQPRPSRSKSYLILARFMIPVPGFTFVKDPAEGTPSCLGRHPCFVSCPVITISTQQCNILAIGAVLQMSLDVCGSAFVLDAPPPPPSRLLLPRHSDSLDIRLPLTAASSS